MAPIAVTGWNVDVVIESNAVGPPFTSYASELATGSGLGFYQTGLPQYAWGLPPSGEFVSMVGDRTMFQFQPYTSKNALVIDADTGLTSGTLTLSEPATYGLLAILANSVNGTNQTGPLTLKFTDGTTTNATYFAPDWESGGSVSIAWFGPGHVAISSGSDTTGPEEPCFYQTTVNVQALMGTNNKPLASLTFGKTSSLSSIIYAVSGSLAGGIPPVATAIAATGWNRDVVIENTASGPPYTSYAAELNPAEGTAYYQTGLPNTTYGLPRTGSFSSEVDGTLFQLQPYTANNALVMSSDTRITSGTLTLATPAIYDSLAVIANSAGASPTSTSAMTINFADGTTYSASFDAEDWFTGTQNIALNGFDRISLTSGATQGGPVYPQFYQTTIDLTALFGPTNKPITSVTFGQAAGVGATGIYGLSGVRGNQTNGTYTRATVTNVPATGILTRSATVGGNVTSTGGATPEVLLYYGTADGGTNAGAWAQSLYVGGEVGSFSQTLTGLSVNTSYYFRVVAINPAGPAWAPSTQSFSTAAASLATVSNLPAYNVQMGAAILSGNVVATGGDAPAVTIYYGTSNGGTTPGAWAQSVVLIGTQTGAFAQAVSGLTTSTTYYYSAQAVNAAGTVWGTPVQSFVTPATNPPPVTQISVLTGRNDNGRTGQNTNETILTLANVNTNTFGKMFSQPLDGCMVAQPVILAGVNIPGLGAHNVVFAATENDSVYAFDADSGTGPNAQPLWQASFIDPANGITPLISATDLQASSSPGFYGPEVGISGTPVIDPTTGTIYVAAKTKEISGTVTNFVYRLHALDVTTGAEKFGGPIVVEGSVPGVGDGFISPGTVEFSAYRHMNRPALLLANGVLTVTFTSHQDFPPYHGWVFTYDAYTLQQLGIFNTSPNGSSGGIWQASSGPAADTNGNIYFETGNGNFDAFNDNYGDTVVKLSTLDGLTLADYFTPYNQLALNLADLDIGSAGLMLLPDSVGSAAHPHLLVAGSKTGVFWLLDRDNLGQFNAADDTQIVQEISGATKGMWVTPAYFNGTIYYCAASDNAKAFPIANGVINTTPSSTSTATISYPGSSLSVSANGVSNAIVWGLDTSGNQNGPAVLHAFNATNLAVELYNSSQNLARDNPGLAIKYTMPTIANGKVYVGTANYLSVFGNLSFLATPVITPDGGVFNGSVTVSISSPSNTAAIYYTLDGSVPTTNSILYTGPFAVTNTGFVEAVAVLAGQPNSGVASASFISGVSLGNNAGLPGSYPFAVFADGPLAYWPLDETNGAVAHDYAGGYNGTYVGPVALAQPGVPYLGFGSPSYSVLFNGSSSYVDIPEGPFNITGAITAMVWVNSPNTPTHFSGLMGHGDSSWRLSINPSGEPGAADGGDADATSSSSIAGTGWHMVAYTYSGVPNVNGGSLYVDGVLKVTNNVGSLEGDSLDVWIGGSPDYGTGRIFSGKIAHAAVFPKALSASQILSLYNAGSIVPNVTLSIAPAGAGSLKLTWSQGRLLQSASIVGPWTTNTASSPYTFTPTNSQMYFKVLVN